ncbi:MAG: DUF1579 domain-containing protein [Planctomycetes bacterium]|nr:DUF1579 domain-containing protein [Planctomycetota bacterium]
MKLRRTLCGFVVGGITALLASQVYSGGAGNLSDDQLLEALTNSAMVGKGQSNLKRFKGDYEQKVKWWAAPDTEAREFKSRSATAWELDGRVMTQVVKGQWLGVDFEGLGQISYNRITDEYVLVWMDTMHPEVSVSRGTFDQSNDTLTFEGGLFDPIESKVRKIRIVIGIVGKSGEAHVEVYDVTAPETEFKFLELESTRLVRRGA